MSKRRSTQAVWRKFSLKEIDCIETAFIIADMQAPEGGWTKEDPSHPTWNRLRKEITRDCNRRLGIPNRDKLGRKIKWSFTAGVVMVDSCQ